MPRAVVTMLKYALNHGLFTVLDGVSALKSDDEQNRFGIRNSYSTPKSTSLPVREHSRKLQGSNRLTSPRTSMVPSAISLALGGAQYPAPNLME
ncbi:hypothetical protein P154DRAFT_16735 [Amniculicola lignicola CBS 123094]|uniref:Uncharacterized protein n=1 Tax=Amniculicola lignicola CBS 123094 TaxID=1392246 RepID=A0A6A5X5E0_9PLEO|nr:hypothetical protein P154DRAFT_16735 [Amniculicola lignicola CBS 123094]